MEGLAQQLGKRIKALRQQRGMTQEQLLKSSVRPIKLTRSHLSQIEKGTLHMQMDTLEIVIQLLHVKPAKLFAGIQVEDIPTHIQ